VDFTLTAEQTLLVDSVSALLDRACPPALVRAVAEGDRGAVGSLSPHLADFAALGDGPVCDQALVAERLGAACAPGPWFVTSALALPLLRAADHDLADAVAAGERAASVAWAGEDGVWRAPPAGDPVRTFVLDRDLVDVVIVVSPGAIGVTAADGPGRAIQWRDLTRTASEIPADDRPTHPIADEHLEDVLWRATVVLAAELCGTARRLLDMTVAYASERVQFDRPIGSFQAVQHLLADLALEVERAWAATQWAAMCLDDEPREARRAAHVSKAAADEAASLAAKTSIQVHGGIGYTWEHDLHLWLRRAITTAHLLGTAEEHHDALGALLVQT
jgi:alkylation response protein AidB-like acyl-CoA dehydrogenase